MDSVSRPASSELRPTAGVMAPPGLAPSYRPLMGAPSPEQGRGLCTASPDAELPSLRGFLWAAAWIVATVVLVTQYAFGA